MILRELDKWEQDDKVKKACQNAIQVLISDEPEPGMENLREVAIPETVRFDDEKASGTQQWAHGFSDDKGK